MTQLSLFDQDEEPEERGYVNYLGERRRKNLCMLCGRPRGEPNPIARRTTIKHIAPYICRDCWNKTAQDEARRGRSVFYPIKRTIPQETEPSTESS